MLRQSRDRIATPDGDLAVRYFSGPGAFQLAAAAWLALYERASCRNPFQHPDWQRIWWESAGKGTNPEFFLIEYRDAPIGFAPLMRRRQGLFKVKYDDLFMLTAFEDPASERAVSGGLDFLWLPEFAHLLPYFTRFLCEKTSGWCYLRLNPVPEGSPTIAAFRESAGALGWPVRTPWVLKNAVLNIEGDWDGYFAERSSKFRKNLRRCERQLAESGPVEFREYRQPGEMAVGLAEMSIIEKDSWKESRGFSIDDHSLNSFYQQIAHFFGERHGIRLWVLKAAQRPIAYDLHIEVGGCIKTLKGSYVAEFADFSPGTLLTLKACQQFFKEGIRQVDFLWGSLHYKEKWTNALETHCGIYLRRRGPGPLLVAGLHELNRRLSRRRKAAARAASVPETPAGEAPNPAPEPQNTELDPDRKVDLSS